MLQTRVFALSVLTDDAKIDVLVPGLVAGNVLDENNGSVDVEFLTESDVEGLVARSLDGSVQDTLQSQLVPLKRSYRFSEELFGVLVSLFHTGHIDLFPLDRDIVCLEDLLDRL